MLPIVLNLVGMRILVVGGGMVGLRKAQACFEAGAIVRVVSTSPPPSDLALQQRIEWSHTAYSAEHLEGVDLVFAAAVADVNARVVADAKRAGVWVNSASEPSAGNVILPAVVRHGPFQLAVSTGGASPAFARRIRQRLASEFDPAVGEFIELLADVRSCVLREIPDPERRRRLLDGFGDWQWLERFRQDGPEPVRRAMLELIRSSE